MRTLRFTNERWDSTTELLVDPTEVCLRVSAIESASQDPIGEVAGTRIIAKCQDYWVRETDLSFEAICAAMEAA